MYIFFFILILLNSILIVKYNFFQRYFSLHDKKTGVPLIGGVYLFVNFLIIGIYFFYDPNSILIGSYFKEFYIDQKSISAREIMVFFMLPSLFFFIGLYDDKFNLNANYRLVLSFLIIFIFLLIDNNFIIKSLRYSNEIEINLFNLSTIFTIICVTGLIFALNMYDGINLQIGFHFLIIFSYFVFKDIFTNFFIIYILLILIFLFLNYKNKIYMGDSGVYFVGSIISLTLLKNYNNQNLNLEEIILISLVPILDMFRVIFLRVSLGLHPFTKDKLHLHYILKKKFNNKFLWHFGSLLTLLNIFLLETITRPYYVLFQAVIIYFVFVILISLRKKN